MYTWEFRLLGPLEGWRDGTPLALTAAKQRTILAALLLRSTPTPLQELIETVWDDPPEGARYAIRSYVMRLRRTCEEQRGELIRTNDIGYQISPEAAEEMSVDLWRFDDLVERARDRQRGDDPAGASDLLHEATGLWRFPLLENVPSSALHMGRVPQLRERYLSAVEERVETDLRLGRHGDVLAPLRALVAEEPLREVFWRQFIVALDAVGRRAEALARYQDLREALTEELGVEPNAELQGLHQRLLRADERPAVDPGGGRVSGGGLVGPGAGAGRAGPGGGADPGGAGVADPGGGPGGGDGHGGPAGPSGDRETVRPDPSPQAPPSPPPPASVPRQLPTGITPLVGRERAVEEMAAMLLPEQPGPCGPLVLLTGTAGVGKSSAAVHAAHRLAGGFPDGQLYADVQGYSSTAATRPGTVLLRFLKALGVAADQVPAHVEERAAMLRSLLSRQRVLTVLDNVGDRAQIEPLLAGGPGCATLVTSRSNLPGLRAVHGARHLRLGPLQPREAEELLENMLALPPGGGDSAEALGRLARLCDGLPLALRIAGANIDGFPEQNMHGYAAELEHSDRLSALRVVGEPDLSVTTAFERSYEQLPEDAQRLFRLLGLLEGMDFTPASASALAGAPAQGALRVLLCGHLIEQRSAARFGMPDLVRRYARQLAQCQESERERRAGLLRFQHFCLSTLRSVSDRVCRAP